jgi:hypothetical protein
MRRLLPEPLQLSLCCCQSRFGLLGAALLDDPL